MPDFVRKTPPSTAAAAAPESGSPGRERRTEPRLPTPAVPVEERREITDAITLPASDAPSTASSTRSSGGWLWACHRLPPPSPERVRPPQIGAAAEGFSVIGPASGSYVFQE